MSNTNSIRKGRGSEVSAGFGIPEYFAQEGFLKTRVILTKLDRLGARTALGYFEDDGGFIAQGSQSKGGKSLASVDSWANSCPRLVGQPKGFGSERTAPEDSRQAGEGRERGGAWKEPMFGLEEAKRPRRG